MNFGQHQQHVHYNTAPQLSTGLPFNTPQPLIVSQGNRPRHPAARALDLSNQRPYQQFENVSTPTPGGIPPPYQHLTVPTNPEIAPSSAHYLSPHSMPHAGSLANVVPSNPNPFAPNTKFDNNHPPSSNPVEAMNYQNLFITKIPRDVTDGSLLTIFKAFGAVSAKVMVDAATGCSKGFGFVVFPNEERGRWVHDNYNKKSIVVSGEHIQAALPSDRPTRQVYEFTMFPSHHDSGSAAKESNSLYIRNVPKSWDSATVVELLRMYGDPIYYAMRDDRLGQPVWVVYAEFDCLQCSKNALKNIHGMRPLVGQPPILAKYADNAEVRKFRRDKRMSSQQQGFEGELVTQSNSKHVAAVEERKGGNEATTPEDAQKAEAHEKCVAQTVDDDTLTPSVSQQASKDNPGALESTGTTLPFILHDSPAFRVSALPQQQMFYSSPNGSLLGHAYLQTSMASATATSSSYYGFHPTHMLPQSGTHSITNGDLVVEHNGSSAGSIYSIGMRGNEGNPLAGLHQLTETNIQVARVTHHPVYSNLQATTTKFLPQTGPYLQSSQGVAALAPVTENSVYGGSVSAAGSTGTDRSVSLNYGSTSPSLLSDGPAGMALGRSSRGGSEGPLHPSSNFMPSMGSIQPPLAATGGQHPAFALRRPGPSYSEPMLGLTINNSTTPFLTTSLAKNAYPPLGLNNLPPQPNTGMSHIPSHPSQFGGLYFPQHPQ